jgi:hypothetical protein
VLPPEPLDGLLGRALGVRELLGAGRAAGARCGEGDGRAEGRELGAGADRGDTLGRCSRSERTGAREEGVLLGVGAGADRVLGADREGAGADRGAGAAREGVD